jgi:stage IV sporulation protein A
MSISENLKKVGDLKSSETLFLNSEYFQPPKKPILEMGKGTITFDLITKENLFYRVLSDQCGISIENDFELIAQIKSLATAKLEWDKIKSALAEVKENGYGVVEPTFEDLVLNEPQIARFGGNRFGVKIKATAPSLHIMRVDVETEINPMIGSEQQSMDLVQYLNTQALENPKGMWETNMFGKTLFDLVKDGLSGKINSMPQEAQRKMRKALTRIVNEGRGGLICILL